MKVSIELDEAEVKGIKQYMQEVDGIDKPSSIDFKNYCQGIVSGTINARQEAVSDYINKFRNQI